MLKALIGLTFGLLFCGAGLKELVDRIRLQRRGRRVPGVIVGRVDAGAHSPGIASRSGVFRFTTVDGQEIEATSAVHSFPGPRPGRRITVVYDPARPHRSAERAGMHLVIMLGVAPLVIAIGLAIAVAALVEF
jgi:hypothetical protein